MNPLARFSLCWLLLLFLLPCRSRSQSLSEEWRSLEHGVPDWFRDAKFGIYFHWGVYTVPAYNSEWYSRTMYVPGTTPYRHHQEKWGPLNRFGYKDFIPLFTAPRFDAGRWAALFEKAGARFAGAVAEHADGFSMWNSRVNPWNAAAMGPHRDVVGEIARAVRKHHMKLVTTFHHQWQWGWYPTFDTSVDAGQARFAALYGPTVRDSVWMQKEGAERPDTAFCRTWLLKVEEVVRNYHPDLLYFDSRLGYIADSFKREMVRQQYAGDRNGKLIVYKSADLPPGTGVRTYEKVRQTRIAGTPWLMEEPISTYSWSYTDSMQLRAAPDLLNSLVDVVSKNGVYLLNICPRADGTIPEEQQAILLEMGRWLRRNGEAIYGTRPWYTYGDGPRKIAEEKGETVPRNRFYELHFTATDVRYTTRGATIYAIAMGPVPAGAVLQLKAFGQDLLPHPLKVRSVTLPGYREKVRWQLKPDGLWITMPAVPSTGLATVFAIGKE